MFSRRPVLLQAIPAHIRILPPSVEVCCPRTNISEGYKLKLIFFDQRKVIINYYEQQLPFGGGGVGVDAANDDNKDDTADTRPPRRAITFIKSGDDKGEKLEKGEKGEKSKTPALFAWDPKFKVTLGRDHMARVLSVLEGRVESCQIITLETIGSFEPVGLDYVLKCESKGEKGEISKWTVKLEVGAACLVHRFLGKSLTRAFGFR